MPTQTPTPSTPRGPLRIAALALFAALALGGAAACSSEGSNTSCSTDSCTVTFDRGVEAKTEILGVEAKLIDVKGNIVTMEVAGMRVSAPVGTETQVGDYTVTPQEVTDDTVKVKISL